jgi:hypothetical protein
MASELKRKANLADVLTLLRGWSDSEFAEAASGEFCEDLKTMIEGAISRALDPTTDASGLVERLNSHMGKQDVAVLLADCREAATHITTLTARVAEQDAEIARLTREIDAARAAGAAEWRDIGSAPMDGTWVLLGRWAVEEAGKEPVFRQSVGFWDERLTGTDDWDDDIGDVVYRGGWTDHTVASFTHEEYTELNPSVWMPLQSPPQSGA